MKPTAPYPVILGETFSNLGSCTGESSDGPADMIKGFKGDVNLNLPESTLYKPYGDGVVFQPFFHLGGACSIPAVLFKDSIGQPVYTPNSDQ